MAPGFSGELLRPELQVVRPPWPREHKAPIMSDRKLSTAQRILLDRIRAAGPVGFEIAPRARSSAAILAGLGLIEGTDDVYRLASSPDAFATQPVTPDTTADAAESHRTSRAPRAGTKAAAVIALLAREEGSTVVQMSEATGWFPHSVRGFLAGALKKTHGLSVTSTPGEGGRVYRLSEGASS